MKMQSELNAMFKVPEGHVPVAIISGGTDHAHFHKVWSGMMDEDIYKDMDGNASKRSMPLSPVMMLVIQSEDDKHLHTLVSLPLQDFQEGMRVEETIENSKSIQRVADWCAGFMETFCVNDSVMALDIVNQTVLVGDSATSVMSIEASIKGVRPQREVRGLESIGDVDDILGQLSKPQIEKFVTKKAMKKEKPEEMKTIPVVEEKEETLTDGLEKMLKEQEAIVKKYGYKALEDMAARMNMPILVKDKTA